MVDCLPQTALNPTSIVVTLDPCFDVTPHALLGTVVLSDIAMDHMSLPKYTLIYSMLVPATYVTTMLLMLLKKSHVRQVNIAMLSTLVSLHQLAR